MARIYCQSRSERNITMIADGLSIEHAGALLAQYGMGWQVTKKGRASDMIGPLELGFYFSDGKLACTMWVDPVPTPRNEPKFTPAKGPIPGLHA